MVELTVQGGIVLFKPDSGWQWNGWDGRASIRTDAHPMQVDGQPVAVFNDRKGLESELIGKQYEAQGFDDIPGSVTNSEIMVDSVSLSNHVTCSNKKVALKSTSGRFRLDCLPSYKAGSPPTPDPILMKTGSWEIEKAGQAKAWAE
jgi:hypothetical protein